MTRLLCIALSLVVTIVTQSITARSMFADQKIGVGPVDGAQLNRAQPPAEQTKSGSIATFRSDDLGFTDLCFSSDGRIVLAIGPTNITLYDINKSTRRVIDVDDDEAGDCTCVAIAPDATTVLIGSDKGYVMTWKLGSDDQLVRDKRFRISGLMIETIRVAPNHRDAIAMIAGGSACVWQIDTGNVSRQIRGFNRHSNKSIYFSKQSGQALISDGRQVALYDLGDDELLGRTKLSDSSGQCLAMSPDGTKVTFNRRNVLHTLEIASGEMLKNCQGDNVFWSTTFSNTGRHHVAGENGQVSLWNVETGKLVTSMPLKERGYVRKTVMSPDGIHFAANGGSLGGLIEIFRLPQPARD